MTRRLATIGLIALCVALTCAAAATAAVARFTVTEAGGSTFPGRAYLLSLPRGMQLSPQSVEVFENGEPVQDLVVTPVGAGKQQQFGVVLGVDASTSMHGRPEEAAFAAARAFAAQRQPNQQLALVTYNVTPTVAMPFTADPVQIDRTLATQPKFVYGTHIYDAVFQALDLLKKSHITGGTIVLLSDGQEARGHGDVAVHHDEAAAAAAARQAHVRVFTVGLRSRLAKLGALEMLSRDTGGRYVEAKSLGALRPIYNELGSELASEYLLHYRSLAGPGKHVNVAVTVAGVSGTARTGYETPQLAVAAARPTAPYQESTSGKIWTSALTMILVGLLSATLVGGGVVAVVSGPRQGTVRQRLAEFVSVPAIRDAGRRPTAQVTEKMLEGTHSLLRNATWWQKFRWELEIAAIGLPAEQIAMLSVIGAFFVAILIAIVFGNIFIGIILALATPFAVRAYCKRQLARRRSRFAEQLPDNLQVLASALRAGHSFIGALSVVVNDAPEPARSEFQRVVADEQLGIPVDQSLRVVVERMDNRELEQVALVAALQHHTGGNTAEVLDRVTDTIRERFELRRTVKTLTAQGRMSRWVLTALPIFVFLIINLINPSYVGILYHSMFGKVILFMAAISIMIGSFVIKRIVNIKV